MQKQVAIAVWHRDKKHGYFYNRNKRVTIQQSVLGIQGLIDLKGIRIAFDPDDVEESKTATGRITYRIKKAELVKSKVKAKAE